MKIKIEQQTINVNIKTERLYPALEDLEIEPTTEKQKFKSKEYGYNNVLVKAVTSSIDNNIKPENIKKNTEILGVTGTFEAKPKLQEKTITKNGEYTADEEYDGETLYGEAKGGHLPGAIHIRYTDLFQKSGMLKSNAEITKMFEDAGITKDDKVVTYCTAGIRSGYMQLILEMCGFKNTQNYDESYYRWCAVEDVEK